MKDVCIYNELIYSSILILIIINECKQFLECFGIQPTVLFCAFIFSKQIILLNIRYVSEFMMCDVRQTIL